MVCEGYSKAFKYLCDLTWTGSDSEVACYLPTGTMDGGDHMWNIVSIGGVNYLTDITNCDSGTIGARISCSCAAFAAAWIRAISPT